MILKYMQLDACVIQNYFYFFKKESKKKYGSVEKEKFPKIFAGGDCVSGPGTVIESIAAGKSLRDKIQKRCLKLKEMALKMELNLR